MIKILSLQNCKKQSIMNNNRMVLVIKRELYPTKTFTETIISIRWHVLSHRAITDTVISIRCHFVTSKKISIAA